MPGQKIVSLVKSDDMTAYCCKPASCDHCCRPCEWTAYCCRRCDACSEAAYYRRPMHSQPAYCCRHARRASGCIVTLRDAYGCYVSLSDKPLEGAFIQMTWQLTVASRRKKASIWPSFAVSSFFLVFPKRKRRILNIFTQICLHHLLC